MVRQGLCCCGVAHRACDSGCFFIAPSVRCSTGRGGNWSSFLTQHLLNLAWSGTHNYAKRIPPIHIFRAEEQAASFALDLYDGASSPDLELVTDNKALHYALRKGRSSDDYVNSVVARILDLRLCGCVVTLSVFAGYHIRTILRMHSFSGGSGR